MRKRLTMMAHLNAFTGYGLHSIQIVRDLERLTGCFVSIRPLQKDERFGVRLPEDIARKIVTGPQPEEWELLLYPPSFTTTPGKKVAYFTMWESSRLPASGVVTLNRAEVVIVPCLWNATCFSANGVEKPIRVVPLGVNPDVFSFRPMALPYDVYGGSGTFTFGAAGRLAHGGVRKGLNEVIAMFQKAFPKENDVRLRVKCYPDCPIVKFNDPRIEVLPKHLSEEELGDWFASLNCFVSAATGEGWGLMQMQAMAIGRPLIAARFGGLLEFFTPGTGYAVDYKLEPAKNLYKGGGVWAVPDEECFIESMRSAYKNREDGVRMGAAASEAVKGFTWEASNRKLAGVLKEFGAL